MPPSSAVQFVSAGLFKPKKRDHALIRRQLFLNYGALSLATAISRAGYKTSLRHGGHDDPEIFAECLFLEGRLPSTQPLMVSIPSFYALAWTQIFCRAVKRRDVATRIVIGGRWVTSPDPHWLKQLIPEADIIIPGLGEAAIWQVLGEANLPTMTTVGDQPPQFALRHSLVDEFLKYQPSLETSRGCGMGCAFCEERAIPLSPLIAPETLVDILATTQNEYGGKEIRPYLESSFFLPNARWAANLHNAMDRHHLRVQWRCETRVDGLKPDTLAALAASGLKVLDLGLESASITQIKAMKKSRHPDRYLQAASQLLEGCMANGIWVKINILLYGGETMQTIAETREWLDMHVQAIKGVSVGPVVVYGPPIQAMPFLDELIAMGARPVDPGSAAECGITQIHLSRELDAYDAEQISLDLSRRYMSANDYFDLKQFSYYPRDYNRADFNYDLKRSDSARLPFRLSEYE